MRGFDLTNPPPTERDPILTAETRFITAEFCSTWARRIVKCSLKIPSKADEEVPNINFVFDVGQNGLIFRLLAVFSGRFLHGTTAMSCRNGFRKSFYIFNF